VREKEEKCIGSFYPYVVFPSDRSHVEDLERDVENAEKKYELFVESISAEIKARKILLTALDQAEKFYRNQRRDVKKVVYVSEAPRMSE
jgi:hypothetical protein